MIQPAVVWLVGEGTLIRVSTCIAVLFVISMQLADAKTAAEQAAAFAKRRGYTAAQTECFMQVWPHYAIQESKGVWRIPRMDNAASRERARTYRGALWSQCHIQR